jgi:hypothetical protein
MGGEIISESGEGINPLQGRDHPGIGGAASSGISRKNLLPSLTSASALKDTRV